MFSASPQQLLVRHVVVVRGRMVGYIDHSPDVQPDTADTLGFGIMPFQPLNAFFQNLHALLALAKRTLKLLDAPFKFGDRDGICGAL